MTFPFSKLVHDMLDTLHMSHWQLMPFAWRTMAYLVDKILAFLVDERMWTNFLNRPIKNSSMVVAEYFTSRMKKAIVKHDVSTFEKVMPKYATAKTKSKLLTHVSKPSLSIQSVSSGSRECKKSEKNIEMKSGRIYGQRYTLCFSFRVMSILSHVSVNVGFTDDRAFSY